MNKNFSQLITELTGMVTERNFEGAIRARKTLFNEITELEAELAALREANSKLVIQLIEAILPQPPEAELAQLRDATCLWKEDLDGPWETACGGAWEFIDDGPEENNCIYCPHCGKRIMVEKQEIESEEE
jgi:DNA-directed RNA polymerase subunit RPC12/RpoP